jgi:hypothetical protein
MKMNKTEMIQKNISRLFCFMTFCSISTTTAATAELVYIQWVSVCMTGASRGPTPISRLSYIVLKLLSRLVWHENV